MQKVFVLSPHTDDGELGCGASMARLIEEGAELFYLVFSNSYNILGQELPSQEPEQEMYKAMEVLGVKKDHILVHPFPVRRFHEHRQDILQVLWDLNAEHKPDLVLMPNRRDLHQDHSVVAAEGMRAFKTTTVLCYEQPWNTVSFDTEGFMVLEERHVTKKIQALECYESQKERTYLSADMLRGWMRTRGVQIRAQYAECFEVPRLIL